MSTLHNTPTVVSFGEDVLERMVLAVEKVRDRLRRSTAALDAAGIPYAVIGGNAVAAWVSKVDPGAARNTVNVNLMINRGDFCKVDMALEAARFLRTSLFQSDFSFYLDKADGKRRDAVELLFANEKWAEEDCIAAPTIENNIVDHGAIHILALEPLVKMKLNSYRTIDRVHVRDVVDVGLVDSTWLPRLQPELASRLQELLDNPDG